MCDCRICTRARRAAALMKTLPQDDKSFVEYLVNELDHVEMERDYLNAVVAGTWTNADKIIQHARGEN